MARTSHDPAVRAVLVFAPLAFALSWYPWALGHLGVQASGINPLGVLAAALVASAVAGGFGGVARLLRGLVRVRADLASYAAALLLAPALALAAAGIAVALGAHPTRSIAPTLELVDRFVVMLVFVGLGEEPGWRGFLLPALARRFGWAVAGLATGAVWALWHLPLWGVELAWADVPAFVASVLGGGLVLTWLYARTESTLLCMVLHASVNALAAGWVLTWFEGSARHLFWWIYGLVWLVAGVAMILRVRAAVAPSDTPVLTLQRAG